MSASRTESEPHVAPYGIRVTRPRDCDDAVVRVDGDLELATATVVSHELERALRTGGDRIVVDLRSLGFLDSIGIHTLVQADRQCRAADRSLVLLLAPGTVRRTLEVSGVLNLLDHVTSEPIAA